MLKVDWRGFYGDELSQPIPMEKYYLDDGRQLELRQMTYEFADVEGDGMYPTFEVYDIVVDLYGEGQTYFIFEYEREFMEMYVELLDENMKRTGEKTYLDLNEVFHKVKDVEWI